MPSNQRHRDHAPNEHRPLHAAAAEREDQRMCLPHSGFMNWLLHVIDAAIYFPRV